jgi:hypothetical protein
LVGSPRIKQVPTEKTPAPELPCSCHIKRTSAYRFFI